MESKYIASVEDGVLTVKLTGRLDANMAPQFMEELKKFIGNSVTKIVFEAKELEYISSAGLRTMIFAKQKVGIDADVVLVSPQEAVKDVIVMSGLTNFMTILD